MRLAAWPGISVGVAEAAEQNQQHAPSLIETAAVKLIGINQFLPQQQNGVGSDILIDNAAVRDEQISKLKQLRRERDHGAVETTLNALSDAAMGGRNLLEVIVDARAGATVGEMSDAMERVFNRHVAETRCPWCLEGRNAGLADLDLLTERIAAFRDR